MLAQVLVLPQKTPLPRDRLATFGNYSVLHSFPRLASSRALVQLSVHSRGRCAPVASKNGQMRPESSGTGATERAKMVPDVPNDTTTSPSLCEKRTTGART